MMTWRDLRDELASANEGSEDLNQMVWARIKGCDYPLYHYDRDTWEETRAISASSPCEVTTSLDSAMAMFADIDKDAYISIQTDGDDICVRIEGSNEEWITAAESRKPRNQVALAFTHAAVGVIEMEYRLEREARRDAFDGP